MQPAQGAAHLLGEYKTIPSHACLLTLTLPPHAHAPVGIHLAVHDAAAVEQLSDVQVLAPFEADLPFNHLCVARSREGANAGTLRHPPLCSVISNTHCIICVLCMHCMQDENWINNKS